MRGLKKERGRAITTLLKSVLRVAFALRIALRIALKIALPIALPIAVVLLPRVAFADADRVKFLAEKLRSDDFRVRTNAALALGASNDDLAVEPLCGALADGSDVVRQASAVAMKRLGRSQALSCLRARQEREGSDGVKIAITRAIESIAAGGGEGNPADEKIKENPGAKYYIALSSIANSTGRPQPEVESLVAKAIKEKLDGAGTIQLAPTKESADAARETMKKRKLPGFYLAVAVDRFAYTNGNLRAKVTIGVFTYPGKSLIGSVDGAASKEGVSNGDKPSEDQLLERAAGQATEKFVQNAHAFL